MSSNCESLTTWKKLLILTIVHRGRSKIQAETLGRCAICERWKELTILRKDIITALGSYASTIDIYRIYMKNIGLLINNKLESYLNANS